MGWGDEGEPWGFVGNGAGMRGMYFWVGCCDGRMDGWMRRGFFFSEFGGVLGEGEGGYAVGPWWWWRMVSSLAMIPTKTFVLILKPTL